MSESIQTTEQSQSGPPVKETYEVIEDCWINGVYQDKGGTVNLNEPEARFLLLSGNIKKQVSKAKSGNKS